MEYLKYFVAFLLVGFSLAQKTYRRGCECEYMVDGKCAYTLMLPASGGSNQMSTCPETNNGQSTQDITKVQEHLQMIKNNITYIENVTSRQSQYLNVLQNAVLAHTVLVKNLTAKIEALPDCKDCQASSSCEECQAVQDLQRELTAIRLKLEEIETSSASIIEKRENIVKVVETDYPALQTRVERLETELNSVRAQMETMKSQIPCEMRDLVVSGRHAAIGDAAITASSTADRNTAASRARIRTQKEGNLAGAWCSRKFTSI